LIRKRTINNWSKSIDVVKNSNSLPGNGEDKKKLNTKY
jgi:hypothetical protein